MTRYWLLPLRVMPFASPSMYIGPSGESVPSRTIVAPSRLGSNRITPPTELIWLAAHRMDPTSVPPLVFVTVRKRKSSDAVAATDGVVLDGIFGATGSSAQAPS